MKEIILTNRMISLVDDEDFEKWNPRSWYAHKARNHLYARGKISGRNIYLHRAILGLKPGEICDHISCDTLDNRKANLRRADRSQNGANTRIKAGRTFKGVFPQVGGWMARIVVNRRPIYLGYFRDEIKAALAYDAAAIKEFGEFAKLNFPEGNVAGLIAAR